MVLKHEGMGPMGEKSLAGVFQTVASRGPLHGDCGVGIGRGGGVSARSMSAT